MADVNVTVNGSSISCSPDPVGVSASSKNKVTFTLTTPGFEFPAAGAIVMKQKASDFPSPAKTVKPTVVELEDRNKVKGLYAYAVKVVETATGNVIEIDPTVANDGGGP